MKVDLDELRGLGKTSPTLAALLAVVDAAQKVADPWVTGPGVNGLRAALEPFTPPAPRPAGVKVTNVGAHVKDMAPEWTPRDLERLRRSLARYVHAEENAVPVATGDLEALLAVVDAAREALRTADVWPLRAALEPFTPEPRQSERDLAVKAAVDAAKGNPRDRARDQLADAGVVVQRQFRSDQERIAELESEVKQADVDRELMRKDAHDQMHLLRQRAWHAEQELAARKRSKP